MNLSWKITFSLLLFLFIPVFTLARKPVPSPELPLIDEVIIVSGEKNHIPDDTNKIVEYDTEISLYAVIRCKGSLYLGYENSPLPDEVKINNKLYSLQKGSLKRWKEKIWGKLNIKWYKITPRPAPSNPKGGYRWYSNVFSEEEGEEGKWRGWQIIEYEQHPLKKEGWSIRLEKQAGTVRFRAEAIFNGKVVSSPGRPDPNHPSGISPADYDKGIKDTVHRISRLSNHPNKLIRYVEALRGVPWLWGADYRDPPRNTPSHHQSDLTNPVGIECSSLLISALRAMGNKDLDYTTTENLARGKYTQPLIDATLTYTRRVFFKEWTPRGIYWDRQGNFYIWGERCIQVRNKNFNLIKKIEKVPFELLDIAISQGKIYSIIEEDLTSKIVLIKEGKDIKQLFIPEVKKTIFMGGKEYTRKVKINPSGIEVDVKKGKIYLFYSGKIYVFDLKGNQLSIIPLEGIYTKWNPTGSLSLGKGVFYIPASEKKILVYNFKGKIVKTIDFQEEILDVSFNGEKIVILHPFPLRVVLYRLDGSFFMDFADRFQDEQGRQIKIKIGSSVTDLRLGDLMITTSPTYHLLLFYRDNGNNFLDSKDEVICAGHQGVEIRKVSSLEGKKFILRRLAPQIKLE
ncbi:hypothetical protein DRJ04_03430 [Candidatus Aerophobetes bacterium]|uniref:Uncharacterized protein n=1 Tax=Aerophobetes bacterium TaxID=2030807 RepID=A0A662DHV0_UNCAE|nr:MAG: hypothetical protein DRJ04_03430 [Candidatus Aerophobetes bacterium]